MPLVLIMLQYLWLGSDFAIAEAVNFVVESERQGSTTLREKMDDQQCELEDLKLKFQNCEASRENQWGEIESSKKQGEESNTLLRRLLCLNRE